MKKTFVALLLFALTSSCLKDKTPIVSINSIESVNSLLDDWHQAATDADYPTYFNKMADESVFIGTDATENWDKKAFQAYSKPHFDKGKAWSFTSLERNVYFNQDSTMAWFDELLDTQMKICRGSGVAVKEGKDWKIKHYVLSMTVPNEKVDGVITQKDSLESLLIMKLKQ